MSKTDYTLWPNPDGNFGNIKVEIPDGVTTKWPDGDALVDNFIYKDGKLVGFVDTKALINNNSKSSNIPYDFVEIHLKNISEGDITFNLSERTKYFTVTYGSTSDTGNSGDTVVLGTKYLGCKTINDVIAIEPDFKTVDIIDGSWTQSLADLEDSTYYDYEVYSDGMFGNCENLNKFTSDLSNLVSAPYMFYTTNISEFTTDLPKLDNGTGMFQTCQNLTSFNIDLSSLRNGRGMFQDCINLTSFNSDLSSLTNGNDMFRNCKLNTTSVQNIADTINTPEPYEIIHISIGNSSPNEQEEEAFNTIASKNWTVYVNGNSAPNLWNPTATTPIDGEQTTTPIPYWAKPVPATEETAEYIDEQGNYYNVLGAQFIYGDSLETYGMFTSHEDAVANMRFTKYERTEKEETI